MQKRRKFLYLNADMSFLSKQKGLKTVAVRKKIVLLFMLITGLLAASSGCQLIRSVTQPDRQDKVNKNIEAKERKSYEEARADFREKHYERQAERTQKRMDYNKAKAESWRENNRKSNSFYWLKQVKNWFRWFFDLFKGRDKGLYNN
jgi:hypothetical protein